MQIQPFFPSVDRTFTKETLEQLQTADVINARLQVVKLFFLTLGDLAVHAFAAAAKLTFTAVQLPLYPFFSTAPRASMIEAGTHSVRVVKLVAAAAFETLPALVRPDLVLPVYTGLGLVREIPASGSLTIAKRVKSAATSILASPRFKPALAATALLAGSLAIGLVCRSLFTTLEIPSSSSSSSPSSLSSSSPPSSSPPPVKDAALRWHTIRDGLLPLGFSVGTMLASWYVTARPVSCTKSVTVCSFGNFAGVGIGAVIGVALRAFHGIDLSAKSSPLPAVLTSAPLSWINGCMQASIKGPLKYIPNVVTLLCIGGYWARNKFSKRLSNPSKGIKWRQVFVAIMTASLAAAAAVTRERWWPWAARDLMVREGAPNDDPSGHMMVQLSLALAQASLNQVVFEMGWTKVAKLANSFSMAMGIGSCISMATTAIRYHSVYELVEGALVGTVAAATSVAVIAISIICVKNTP